MKHFLTFTLLVFLIVHSGFSQDSPDYIFANDNGSGWDWTTGTQGSENVGNSYFFSFQATADENHYLKFGETSSNVDGSGFWTNSTGDDMEYTGNGIRWECYHQSNMNDGGAIFWNTTTDNYYVLKTQKNTENTNAYFAIFNNGTQAPVTITSTTNDYVGDNLTITAALSGAMSANEKVWVRYTKDGWITHQVVELDVNNSGNNWETTITLLSDETIEFYSFTTIQQTTVVSDEADFYAVAFDTNGGDNYVIGQDYDLTFNVSDGANPVSGATIDINGSQLSTDAAGQASISLDNGTYDYTVTATGFIDNSGQVTINGADATEDVTMTAGFAVTFNVDMNDADSFDPATEEVYVTGSMFGWTEPGTDASQKMTDSDNDMIYTLETTIATGDYDYKYFTVATGTSSWDNGEWTAADNRAMSVVDAAITLNDTWNAFNLEFTVEDEANNPIQNATIDIEGEQLITDVAGLANIMLAPNADPGYTYIVSATGFSNNQSAVTINYQDTAEEVTMLPPDSYTVTFNVSDGTNPVSGATIDINGSQLTTIATGVATIELDNGTYDYTVTANGFIDNSGQVTVAAADVTEDVTMTAGFAVTFNVDMNDAASFDPATEEVYVTGSMFGWTEPGTDASQKMTDPDNDMIYTLETTIATGDYDYKYFTVATGTSSWDNGEWTAADNRAMSVVDAAITLNDTWNAFNLEFTVEDEANNPIENATIDIDSQQLTTDAAGQADIMLAPNADPGYTYTVSATGFSNNQSTVTINYQDTDETVTMLPPNSYTVTFNVSSSSIPVSGATIDINGSQLSTDATGVATIELDNGTYDYTVTATGFIDASGQVTVAGADVVEDVVLAEGISVTFNMDMGEFDTRDFDPATDEVYISGSMFGWPEPGTDASVLMTDPDNDMIYTLETTLAAGDYEYKYFSVAAGSNGWDGGEWSADVNREVTVADSPLSLDNTWNAFEVTFTVTNNSSTPIEDATIDIEGQQITTDAAGQASIMLAPENTVGYEYEVAADGYINVVDDVIVDYENTIEAVTLYEPANFTVTFYVDMNPAIDSGLFVPDVDQVFVSGSPFGWPEPGTDATLELIDPDGDHIYGMNQGLSVGSYEYKYFIVPSGTGSSWDYGEWTGGENRTFQVTDEVLVLDDIWPTSEVEFHVINEADEDIQGAVVSIEGNDYSTSITGIATAVVSPNNTTGINYTVSAAGYADAFGNVIVNYENASEEVVMLLPETYTVTFDVSDGTDPVVGADIQINGTNLTTDATGTTTIDLLNGLYPYVVSADGFLSVNGEVTVNGGDEFVQITMQSGNHVTFYLDMSPALEISDFDPATDKVYVTGTPFDWQEPGTNDFLELYDYDGDMIYTMDTAITSGSHEYKYFYVPEGTGSSWDYGEWIGGDNRTIEIDGFTYIEDVWGHFEATFHVINTVGADIANAQIEIDGETLTTNSAGLAMVYLIPDATTTYSYIASADGFYEATGEVLINYQEVMEEVVLEAENAYIITFTVTDGTNPISDATVMLEGYGEQITDAAGIALFLEVVPGDIFFTVDKDGYVFYQDSVTVVNQNVEKEVILIPVGNENVEIFNISVYPNPVTDYLFIKTDIAGEFDIELYSLSGNLIRKKTVVNETQIPFEALNHGVYFLRISNEEIQETYKIIK